MDAGLGIDAGARATLEDQKSFFEPMFDKPDGPFVGIQSNYSWPVAPPPGGRPVQPVAAMFCFTTLNGVAAASAQGCADREIP